MKTIEEIKEFLEDMSESDIFYMWNEYSQNNYYNDEIYEMEEFDEIMSNSEPTDIARRIFYGDFNPNHDYFCFNGYENLKSSDYLDELISYSDLAQYIYDNDEDFNNDKLRDFLDEDENNEEDEEF